MKIYKKWWFWVGIILIIALIAPTTETKKEETMNYLTKYTWDLKDTKTDKVVFYNGEEEYKYVVLGIENNNKDLKSGEYIFKTNDNSKASFMIYVTDEYYEKPSEIPEKYMYEMVQGFDNSEVTLNLKSGQYLYLCQNYNGQGKIYVNAK